jgi:hypothetical protein
MGNGPFASLSRCRPAATVVLHARREDAERSVRVIDGIACGARRSCKRDHEVVDLAAELTGMEWEV